MQLINQEKTLKLLDFAGLIPAIAACYASPPKAPQRTHHDIDMGDDVATATLLMMPAWQAGDLIGIKLASIFPDNSQRNEPSVYANYILLSGETGKPLAMLDGTSLTLRRTAAVSALAADHLARRDASTLLMVGTGALAPHLIEAHTSVRNYERILLWGRDQNKANSLAKRLPQDVSVVSDLDTASSEVDVVSCATLAKDPLIFGAHIRPGTHVDLVGAYRPDMAEADADLMGDAWVFVDTRDGALAEAGDIVRAMEAGQMSAEDIVAGLSELHEPDSPFTRNDDDEITIFKSVGSAISDFAAARYIWQKQEEQ